MGHKTVTDYLNHLASERIAACILPNEYQEIEWINRIDNDIAFVAKYFIDEYVIWKMETNDN